ncbi:hypothetical protein [Shewanella surugensis]|uniref:GNAT family N-acetyltransferase n=1 Tax=Shewanella surugensis TaxID=212020 RepID=A0ABT0L6X8_9GAMM|nr:hypothetical protein [Shewanella surugensis]MCL1123431.1 hypothetical protein [Shewanella surugensis]
MNHTTEPTTSTHPADEYCQYFAASSSCMIENVQTHMSTLVVSEHCQLPMSLNNTEFENSYVCSPYTAFVPYCLEELDKLNKPWLESIIKSSIHQLDRYLKRNHINKVVHVNNWLLSTNLYPASFSPENIASLTATLVKDYPDHAIIFRSLNDYSNAPLIAAFKHANYTLAPSRQVYIYDRNLSDYSRRHNYKKDRNLLKKTSYRSISQAEITPDDYPRIIELYNMLYVSKYSQLNPQFTEAYLDAMLKHPHFSFEGFRNPEGVIDAITGHFTIDNIVTAPIVGYDTTQPQKLGLYRLAAFSGLGFAESNGFIFNASSGAAHFKRQRGACPIIEYSAVYTQHLPKKTQRMWRLLSWITNNIFVPLIKKYKL